MAADRRLERVLRFFAGNASSYDRVVRLLTLGADSAWKNSIVQRCPPDAGQILDLGCGTGILTFALARRYPQAGIVGVDVMPQYLAIAIRKAKLKGIDNVSFLQGRAEEIPLGGHFDCITGSYLPKYVDADRLSRTIASRLRPGGQVVLHDFAYPSRRRVGWAWRAYLGALRMAGPRLFPEWRSVFVELPGFLRGTSWVDDLRQGLANQGLSSIQAEYLSWGTAAIVSAEGTLRKAVASDRGPAA